MANTTPLPDTTTRALRWPIRLTRLGMLAERVLRGFWPLFSIIFLVAALLMMGVQDELAVEAVWAIAVASFGGALYAVYYGIRSFIWPTWDEALDRLDQTLPGRPIAAITDTQAIGSQDPASQAVWDAHIDRMAERAKSAKPVQPDLTIARRDPFALRYVALLAFVTALIFGSVLRVASVTQMTPGMADQLATGPAWEGWVEPPAYTGAPSLYLNDITNDAFRVPEGSRLTLRLYGEVGALTVSETVSGRTEDVGSAADINQEFEVTKSGTLSIDGQGGRSWNIVMVPDSAPSVSLSSNMESEADGQMQQRFLATDDFGVVGGTATINIDLVNVDRRHGLVVDPDPREPIVLDAPMPISGNRAEFEETLIENLSEHPFANLPVTLQIEVEDALGQTGQTALAEVTLPGRRFFDPLAKSVIEQRRDLLWSKSNAPRVAQILRTVSHRPEDIYRSETAYLRTRMIIRRLEAFAAYGFGDEEQEEITQALWDLAILLEDGSLSDALERLRRAQDQLSEAMRDGASDEEIAELMQELREAMQDYMRQLAEQSDPQDGQQSAENMQEITGDQLQDMMDRIQELMEQGRMAEAQQLLDQLNQMMENMRVTQGQQGQQGQQSPGEQAMEGLAETLREQQGLSDEAFRDLQEQFNPNAQAGESAQNEGRSGGQGRGQEHTQQGQGQGQGEQQGEGQQPGQQQGSGQGQAQNQQDGQGGPGSQADTLADRQQALRDELSRQQGSMPGAGTPEGDAAREALGRAGEAMDNAEEALRQNDLAEAIDNQSAAMEALREGMRNLGDQMAQQQQQQGQGEQGDQFGQNAPSQRDPLGREQGNSGGQLGTEQGLLQDEDVYRRARDLLDEIRRRSGETERPEVERDYLRRLLDRF
ncbi:TIGR02302 family protein [Cognatishimia sp. MH4019]|uniref:TIGR02302 family protein n=1 Tax=Cognatishimia sp. MH4019 TaxID=2854030 RepID=UPI001CD6A861|nr:TIGR02302 family protein [Cognatishimia sp. MH4019]